MQLILGGFLQPSVQSLTSESAFRLKPFFGSIVPKTGFRAAHLVTKGLSGLRAVQSYCYDSFEMLRILWIHRKWQTCIYELTKLKTHKSSRLAP